MADITPQEMASKLLATGYSRSGPAAESLTDPIADTPMQVTLDELRPYELDPRITRNPLYDEIKASIRERGLDAPPPITRRPGADHYIIRNGGNTRLAILRELWTETKDERFFRITCLFRPWPKRGEIVALTGHLAENELHGGLTFIERALGVEKARELYEQEEEDQRPLSQSELARRLAADGYPIPQSHISRMQDAVRYLLPAIPNILYGGLGRHQAERLAVLRKSAELVWRQHAIDKKILSNFEDIFQEVLSSFDGQTDTFNVRRFQDELVGHIAELLDVDYNALELDIDQIERRQRAMSSPPAAPGDEIAAAQDATVQIPILPNSTANETPTHAPTAPTQVRAGIETPTIARNAETSVAPTPTLPPATKDPSADADARLQAHIVSPAANTERLHAIQQMVADHTGEERPDFTQNALRAIPVQVGSLFPITDVWYIEEALDTPDRLRIHIAQFASEIANEAGVADLIQPTSDGIGFFCTEHADDTDAVSEFGSAVLILLESLTSTAQQRPQRPRSSAQRQEHLLSGLLLGTGNGRPSRLSDDSIVKLFRLLRLARRLIEMDGGATNSASQ